MQNKLTLLLLVLFSGFNISLNAKEIDSTVTILSNNSSYFFTKEKGSDKIIVKEIQKIQYKCNRPTILPVAAYYNENVKITKFECKINNRSIYQRPTDTYVSIKDIFHSDARVSYYELNVPNNGMVEVIIEKSTLNPVYFTNIPFTEDYKTLEREISIKIPKWMNVSFKEYNLTVYNIKKTNTYNQKDDSDIILYRCQNLAAYKRERNSPGNTYVYPHLLALSASPTPLKGGYFASLQEQYDWYSNLTSTLNEEKETAIVTQAEEITKGITEDLDKVKAIFYWIQHNIRYIAFEDGIAGFRPDKASEVLRKKYGDCKGMANLTKTMLKALNLDARLCWIGTNHIAYNYETPSLAVDNHMISALKLNDKFYFLDATETYLGLGEYAERIQGRQVLIEDGKNYILSHIPKTFVDQNLEFQKKKLKIDGKNLIGSVEQIWIGEEKESMLSRINGDKKNEFLTNFTQLISNGNNNYEVKDLKYSDLNNYDKKIDAQFNVTIKNNIDVFDKEQYISIDATKEFDNYILDTIKRHHDYWMPYKFNVQKEIILEIPTGSTVVNKPENLLISTPDYLIDISYELLQNQIVYKKHIKILNPAIKKSDFGTWNTNIKKLTKYYQEPITLKTNSK
ncbi:Transglutaminase-like superfamily protein [compost metagenome]